MQTTRGDFNLSKQTKEKRHLRNQRKQINSRERTRHDIKHTMVDCSLADCGDFQRMELTREVATGETNNYREQVQVSETGLRS